MSRQPAARRMLKLGKKDDRYFGLLAGSRRQWELAGPRGAELSSTLDVAMEMYNKSQSEEAAALQRRTYDGETRALWARRYDEHQARLKALWRACDAKGAHREREVWQHVLRTGGMSDQQSTICTWASKFRKHEVKVREQALASANVESAGISPSQSTPGDGTRRRRKRGALQALDRPNRADSADGLILSPFKNRRGGGAQSKLTVCVAALIFFVALSSDFMWCGTIQLLYNTMMHNKDAIVRAMGAGGALEAELVAQMLGAELSLSTFRRYCRILGVKRLRKGLRPRLTPIHRYNRLTFVLGKVFVYLANPGPCTEEYEQYVVTGRDVMLLMNQGYLSPDQFINRYRNANAHDGEVPTELPDSVLSDAAIQDLTTDDVDAAMGCDLPHPPAPRQPTGREPGPVDGLVPDGRYVIAFRPQEGELHIDETYVWDLDELVNVIAVDGSPEPSAPHTNSKRHRKKTMYVAVVMRPMDGVTTGHVYIKACGHWEDVKRESVPLFTRGVRRGDKKWVNENMDGNLYVLEVKLGLLAAAKQLHGHFAGRQALYLQQDNAPGHGARAVLPLIHEYCEKLYALTGVVIITEFQPARSPDTNVLDASVFASLKAGLKRKFALNVRMQPTQVAGLEFKNAVTSDVIRQGFDRVLLCFKGIVRSVGDNQYNEKEGYVGDRECRPLIDLGGLRRLASLCSETLRPTAARKLTMGDVNRWQAHLKREALEKRMAEQRAAGMEVRELRGRKPQPLDASLAPLAAAALQQSTANRKIFLADVNKLYAHNPRRGKAPALKGVVTNQENEDPDDICADDSDANDDAEGGMPEDVAVVFRSRCRFTILRQ